MAVHISGFLTATYSEFSTAGETYILDTFARISVTDAFGALINSADGITLRVDGIIDVTGGGTAGIFELGSSTDTTIEIAESGMVRGYWGLLLQGSVARVVNDGLVEGEVAAVEISASQDGSFVNNGAIMSSTGYGLWLTADTPSFTFENDGLISAATGIRSGLTDGRIELGRSSRIIAWDDNAIYCDAPEGGKMTLVNEGYVRAADFAYFSGNFGIDRITNSGRMIGDVELGGDADRFTMTGGKVDGTVWGGTGDDTFIVRKGSIEISEASGQGEDTLKTAIGYVLGDSVEVETIVLTGRKNIAFTGSDTDNDISGNAGRNRLDGGAGADTLTGGKGRDIFVFAPSTGTDTITDFRQGEDRIEIGGLADVENFRDLKLERSGKDVVIDSGMGEILIIENARLKDFDKGDFLFA